MATARAVESRVASNVFRDGFILPVLLLTAAVVWLNVASELVRAFAHR